MGELLTASEIIRNIDQGGNRDGVATLEDIQPHLNEEQKIPLSISENLEPSEVKFRHALATLNQICENATHTFQMPAILNCAVLQNGVIDAGKLEKVSNSFVKTFFDRAFNNKHSDDTIQVRYKEFLSFVEANHIPLSELFNVLTNMNYFRVPLEEVLAKNFFLANDQASALFQLILYAAMWHLKYNIKAFVPEELARYPEWFQSKVSGFENNVLERLRRWELSPQLGDENILVAAYHAGAKQILFSKRISSGFLFKMGLSVMWHELFHAFRAKQAAAEARWIAERDARFVEAIALFKQMGIHSPNDNRLQEYVRIMHVEPQGVIPTSNHRKMLEFVSKIVLTEYRYSFYFFKQEKTELRRLEEAMENIYVMSAMPVDHTITWPPTWAFRNTESIRNEVLTSYERWKQELSQMEAESHVWPPEDKQGRTIGFFDMVSEVNLLSKRYSDGIGGDVYLKITPYLEKIQQYAVLLFNLDLCDFILGNLNAGLPYKNWRLFSFHHNTPRLFQFTKENKWAFLYKY